MYYNEVEKLLSDVSQLEREIDAFSEFIDYASNDELETTEELLKLVG